MPPILAFSSVVDATVLAPALVENLFDRLDPGPHELVLFDINHISGIEPLLAWSPDAMVALLQRNAGRRFALSVVTNRQTQSAEVIERRWQPGRDGPSETPLGLQWPKDVYSLSHVALPFPPDDPVYGGRPNPPSPGVHLGDIALLGERGCCRFPRMRCCASAESLLCYRNAACSSSWAGPETTTGARPPQ
jgi:hypothetical protein